jgi:hypothetical protein
MLMECFAQFSSVLELHAQPQKTAAEKIDLFPM